MTQPRREPEPGRAAALVRGPAAAPRRSVCIVTPEFVGLWRNGGIGTALTGLAELLVAAGHEVTILYSRGFLLTDGECRAWQTRLQRAGMRFLPLRPAHFRGLAGPLAGLGLLTPAAVLAALAGQRFDIVHIVDTGGDGFLLAAAHRFGLVLPGATVIAGLHSPTVWIDEVSGAQRRGRVFTALDAAERLTVAAADIVWAPSRYMLGWAARHGFALPPRPLLQQYVLPRHRADTAAVPAGTAMPATATPIRTVVLFGRIEERKGLRLFLDALDRIAGSLARRGVEVVFLGRIGQAGRVTGDRLIRDRAGRWRFRWRIESGLDRDEALAFLAEPGRLAVIAAPADNSPCTVYEVLERAIPFVAAATGGIAEIIHPDDHAAVLFAYTAADLARRLEAALSEGLGPARPAVARAENEARWLRLHADPATSLRPLPDEARPGWSCRPLPPGEVGAGCRPQGAAPAAAEPIVMVLAPDHRAGDSQATLASLAGLGAASTLRLDSAGTLVAALRRETQRHPGGPVLLLRAGVIADPAALAAMLGRLDREGVAGLWPSVVTLNGRRLDPPAASEAVLALTGPMPTGIIALSGETIRGLLAGAAKTDADPLSDLLRPILGPQAAIWPYPGVVAHLPDRLARGLGRRGRIRATVAERLRDHRRGLGFALLASRLGPLAPPLLRGLQRLRDLGRRG